ncbi:hypothetical protein [Roseateles sp.]|uniref:hypothetical protein n=1 Tax=Roseateles sp. TaxID=1971397 RepID=UPI003BA934DE
MQPEYLDRLNAPVRNFVLEVEQRAGITIQVIPDQGLNRGGPLGQGNLAVVIEDRRNIIFAPTNGYFPDGAVRHELLHLKRFHVDGVPKLAAAATPWGIPAISPDAIGALDNAIEHIVIVPWELQHHPERREHWEAVLQDVCDGLSDIPLAELRLAISMHCTFLRHVLPGSRQAENVRAFAVEHGIFEAADQFAGQFLQAAASKENLVRLLFHTFPEIPKEHAAMEYVSSRTGVIQKPIS